MYKKVKIQDIDFSKLKTGYYFVLKEYGIEIKYIAYFNGNNFDIVNINYVLIEQ